ncbi:MAG TPA: hypothetical protein VGO47_04085, partial [Chlamydiales bacterium]|nr:hypothetical protein [Chlamydiales bacterium]
VLGSAILDGTTVKNGVNVGGNITATKASADAMNAGGKIALKGSRVSGQINAGNSVTAIGCEQLGEIKANGCVELDGCPHVNSVSANDRVTLHESKVLGNVCTSSDVTIQDSTIEGTLTCVSNYIAIDGSHIDTIDLRNASERLRFLGDNSDPFSQIIRLHNCTVKNIIFESGNGQVILAEGSTVTGTITGGQSFVSYPVR